MSVLMPGGPLSPERSDTANYRVQGPERKLYLQQFPRRLRAVLNGEDVLDTVGAALLHETGESPRVYVPAGDLVHLREETGRTENLPGKGEAHFYRVAVGEREAVDAVWTIPEPEPGAEWLRGWFGVRWDALDAWYDEDEQVFGGLTDPFHRVDVRPSSRRVRVVLGTAVLAESAQVMVVSETGLPNRFYVPEQDVRVDRFADSSTSSICPYKGTAEYADAEGESDVAWRYRDPLSEALPLAGMWSFDDSKVDVQADQHGRPSIPRMRTPEPPLEPTKRIRDNHSSDREADRSHGGDRVTTS